MGKFIDETNNRYGNLVVQYRVEAPKGKPAKWHCICDCGNEIDVYGTYLRNGNTKSCGCLQRKRATESNIARGGNSLIGQSFGRLTVLNEFFITLKSGKRQRYCNCQCECGNLIEVSAAHLRNGHTKSCGCLVQEIGKSSIINEQGNRYGKLLVLEEYGRNKEGRVLWRCQCDCGNEKIVSGKTLRAGLCQSCGCIKSIGEERTARALTELKITYAREYSFEDLWLNEGWPLRFDFAIIKDNKVVALIECQGEQHYKESNLFNDESLKVRDALKKEYCIKNNISLFEIPYTDYNKINKEYIKEMIKW